MKSIKIAVYTKNMNYGKALARGLALESTGIEVICAENEITDNYDILLTDFETLSEPRTLVLSDDNSKSGYVISKKHSVKEILKNIIKMYLELCGKTFVPQMTNNTQIIGVAGTMGGAGVTAVSLTMGRILAMQSDKTTVYLNCSASDDYTIYIDCDLENTKTVQELIFRLNYEGNVFLQDYIKEDSFGLKIFKGSSKVILDNLHILVKYICASENIEYMILDVGKNTDLLDICHHSFLIGNCNDSRCQGKENILNFSDAKGENRVRKDCDSFEICDQKVSISLEGVFSEDIQTILSSLVN